MVNSVTRTRSRAIAIARMRRRSSRSRACIVVARVQPPRGVRTQSDDERMTRVGPMMRACTFWPKRPACTWIHDPVRGDVPALLLDGTMDPATPVADLVRRATYPPQIHRIDESPALDDAVFATLAVHRPAPADFFSYSTSPLNTPP